MSGRHTPGPWFYSSVLPHWKGDAEVPYGQDCLISRNTDDGGIELIAKLSMRPMDAEVYPDAKLIAAAPELLDQHDSNLVDLDLLRRAISEGDPTAELLIRVDDIVRRTKEAIAKATMKASSLPQNEECDSNVS